jgi:uncharacterized membrane protein YhaH (DUF805 family)
MKIAGIRSFLAKLLVWLPLLGCYARLDAATSAPELTFDLLKIGTQTFTNVTVTTRNDDYVFLIHKGGMISFKVANLPDETRAQLGYNVQTRQAKAPVAVWAKEKLAQIRSPEVKRLEENCRKGVTAIAADRRWANPKVFGTALGCLALLYLGFSYCSLLICRKAGKEPGALIWIPVAQLVPMLQAAGMSPLWVLAWLVPVVNLGPVAAWSVKIARARGKSVWIAVLLLFPLTSPAGLVYLAFSSSPPAKEEPPPKLMTLEAA